MGKYIQPNRRQAAPIFPQMPKGQQQMGSQQKFSDRNRPIQEERPKEQPVAQTQPIKNKQPEVPENTSKSRKMTVNDLRNGLKMSIILGEPVSKKHRKFK